MAVANTIAGTILGAALLFGLSSAWAQADPVQIVKGEQVYREKTCALCHMIRGQGGKTGPELSEVGAKRDAQWLKGFLKEPKAMMPKAKMLPFKGSDEELEALVAYLASLK
ncbi:c-type cytochrome [Nitrospira sp. Kam-Ns4a]